ncbi:MAG: apolipoprotein N-acyltransferase [Elusimicrobia bacterium]|nr:apolipoprotein N-acyltransferase [Elusimicrobiota bacterium]
MDAPGFRGVAAGAALPLACGALLALCLPRAGLWPLGWVALAPLFALWSRQTPRKALLGGLAAGFGFHGLAFYWIYSTCRFAGLPRSLAAAAWAALALIMALDWAVAAGAGAWLARRAPEAAKPWLWAALWSAMSFSIGRWTSRPSADLLGYTQYAHPAFLQMDSMFGPEGLGFIVAAFNAALGLALWSGRRGRPRRSAVLNLAAAGLLALGAWSWGREQMAQAPKTSPQPSLAVELLQPNVDQYRKWNAAFVRGIWSDLEGLLARPRRRKPALIVWPEAAAPRLIADGQSIPEAAVWSRRLDAFQIVGAVTVGDKGAYNSAVLIEPDGSFGGAYHKRVLVPFGEYVPIPILRRWIGILDELGNLTPGGPRQPLFQTPLGTVGVAVCYEMIFPRLIRQDAARGARVIVNITNDGWYKDTWGPYQHFMASRFRAIENRVYVLRAANTGISGIVDPWGRILAEMPLGKNGRLDTSIPAADPFPHRSFYARHGDWFGALCLALILAWSALRLILDALRGNAA